ncbi:MAG: DUF4166 domain-containing protein [Rhodospirillales bacterium]
MRVIVLGGYGVFGSLLAQLLLRDGHEVWIAGRRLAEAQRCAKALGGHALEVGFLKDPAPLLAAKPQVVVDAAGPFQHYGTKPYAVAELCIAEGIDYLDLSDDADFTIGISRLDDAARAAGCRALSGASSVPGLSSIVVSALAEGLEEIDLIETAILPGNRAPRGASVIASIVGQVGRSTAVWRGEVWRSTPVWSDKRRYEISPGDRRTAYLIGVPDLRLFPQAFKARSVVFRAGMELGLMNAALVGLRLCRRYAKLPFSPRAIGLLLWLSNRLKPFGSDRGGMLVAIIGRRRGIPIRREWRLLAEAGAGPFVPAIVVRALLRSPQRQAAGARPCLAETSLTEIDRALADLAVTSTMTEEARPSLFQSALRERWDRLPPCVRRLHSVQDIESFSGLSEITRGASLMARLAARIFGFPKAGREVPVTITKTRTASGETWERRFAERRFRSHLTPAKAPYRYRERFLFLNYEQDLPVVDGTLHLPVRRGWCLGLPIPKALLPRSDSREYEEDGSFHFDVALSAPLGGGLIVRYRGSVRPDAAPTPP